MAVLALVLYVAFLVYGGWRILRHYRQTGASPLRPAVRPELAERFGHPVRGGCVRLRGRCACAGPDRGAPTAGGALGAGRAVIGIALALLGFAGWERAVTAMGESWRLGVDPAERTRLVTDGPFRYVRNPIYTSMMVGAVGLATLVPNVVAWAGVALLVVGFELLVRKVEEPHLLRSHGEAYLAYATRAGRFVPGVGRLPVEHVRRPGLLDR